jgi:hypothetical protein
MLLRTVPLIKNKTTRALCSTDGRASRSTTKPPKITVHSANPSARDKMFAGISAIDWLAQKTFPHPER